MGATGSFVPTVSLNGAADLLGLVSTVVLVWLILFDLPSDGGRGDRHLPRPGRGDRDRLWGGRLQHAARRPLFPVSMRRGGAASGPDPKAEVGDALALGDPGRLELDVVGAEVVEEPPPLAE